MPWHWREHPRLRSPGDRRRKSGLAPPLGAAYGRVPTFGRPRASLKSIMAANHYPRVVPSQRPAGMISWRQVFFTGLILWLASVLVTGLTGNLNMIPTVLLLG